MLRGNCLAGILNDSHLTELSLEQLLYYRCFILIHVAIMTMHITFIIIFGTWHIYLHVHISLLDPEFLHGKNCLFFLVFPRISTVLS